MIPDEAPPVPWPDTTLANFVRAVNVITAISGLVVSIVAGLFFLFLGGALIFTIFGAAVGLALLAILPILYWGCGGYGEAFTRFGRFPLPKLTFQTLMMGVMLTVSVGRFLKAPDLPSHASSWEIFRAILSIFIIFVCLIALVFHMASLSALVYFRNIPDKSRADGKIHPAQRP